MATDHNFKVKNGLNVEGAKATIVGDGDDTRITSTGEIRFRPEGSSSNKVRITLNTTHISGSLDASANVDANQFRINGTTIIDSSRNLSNIGTISSGTITSSGNINASSGHINTANQYLNGAIRVLNSAGDGWNVFANRTSAGIFDLSSIGTLSTSGNITTGGTITASGSSGSSFYALQLSRSGSGTATPDIWGTNGTLVIGTSSTDEVLGMSGTAATFYGNLSVTGNLTVSGTQTTLNTTTLQVEDKNIVLNYGTGDTSGSADGAGITIQDAVNSTTDATILWGASDDRFNFSHMVNIETGGLRSTGSTSDGNAYSGIFRKGDGSNTLLIRNDGVVLVPSNYFYVNSTQGAYIEADLRVRGSLLNDTSGESLKIADNTHITGTIFLGATSTANDQFATNNGTDIFLGTSAKGLRTYKDLHTNSGNNKYWHAGNDGSGSGLDADLLDGQHGSYYLNYNNFTNTPTSLPANGGNSDTVDNLHAASFLRSDAADTSSATYIFSRTSTTPVFDISGHAGASSYNYFLRAGNDGGNKAVHFVNGSTRTADHGANAYVIRNDGGKFVLGKSSYPTELVSSGNLTINNNTAWHAGNDGSGSGLDADTLDGVNSGSFLRSDAADTATHQITFNNTPILAGTTSSEGGELNFGAPTGGVYSAFALDNYQGHFRVHTLASGKEFRIHSASSGLTTIGSNIGTVWASGNDGSGSGLDADLLDGQHGSYYTTAANLTGDFPSFVQIGDSSSYGTNSGSWGARLNVTDNVHAKIEVGQDADSMLSHWYAHTGHTSIKFGTSSSHDVEFQRAGSTLLELEPGGLMTTVPIRRNSHHASGFLEGSYNSVGSSNNAASNPIYTIGSSYNPAQTTLSNMYGIGFTKKGNATFLGGFRQSGWGMYVASDGDARVFLNAQTGVVASTGGYDVGAINIITGARTLQNVNIDAGLITSGTIPEARLPTQSKYLRSDTADTATGRITLQYGVTSDFNSIGGTQGVTAFYAANVGGVSNRPDTGNYATGLEFVYHDTSARSQLAAGSVGSNNQANFYVRSEAWSATNSWTSWYKLWHTGNDGSGSGLDADLLDGQHGSYYQNASNINAGTLNVARLEGTVFRMRGSVNVTTSSGGHNSYPFDDAHTETRVAEYGARLISYTGASATMLTINTGGSASVFQIGAHYNGNDFYMRTRTDSTNWQTWKKLWHTGNDGAGSGLDADTLDGQQGSFYQNAGNLNAGTIPEARIPTISKYLRSDTADTATGQITLSNKRTNFGGSGFDGVGFSSNTNLHMQNHNQFWIGAGNGTWFTGTANTKSQASGLAADAGKAHDLLITTMQATSTYDRGITFAVDSNGQGTAGWRLGKWHSGDARDSSKLVVDGQLFAKGGYTDEYDYYANDYSGYYSSQGGNSQWTGDSGGGWNVPGIVSSTALQIQSSNYGTTARKPQLQFHQYGYGGIAFEYDGPNDTLNIIGNSGRLSNTGFKQQGNTIWHAGNDGPGSGLDADTLDGKDHTKFGATLATYGTTAQASGRIRCTAPFNTNSAHMFQITVSVYSDYTCHSYVVSGYMYPTSNQWYLPKCVYTGTGTPDIKVGRDSNGKAYISIANGAYTGVRVHNMTRGYQTSLADTYDPWTITIDGGTENSVTPTVSKVWHSTNDGTGSGLDADTLDGQQGSYYQNASNLNAGTIPEARIPTISKYLRSDTSDTMNFNTTSGEILKFANSTSGGKIQIGFQQNDSDGMHHRAYFKSYKAPNTAGNATGRFDIVVRGSGGSITSDVLALEASRSATWRGNTLWDSANDGTGSGLDADTLDGIDSGSFMRSDTADSFTAVPTFAAGSNGTLASRTGFSDFLGYNASYGSYIGGGVSNAGSKYLYAGGFMNDGGTVGTLWRSTNDGTGSGLDADTVDGKHKDFLMHYKGIVSGNWDTIFSQTAGHMGVYQVENISNTDSNYPSGAYTYGGVMSWQLANSTFKLYAPHVGQLFYQTGWNNDEYSGWRKIWDTGNDGSGSGLDADLLDGQQGSYYQNAGNLNAGTIPEARLPTISKYLRSDTADTGSGKITLTATEGLEVGGIRGRAIGDQSGDFIQLYERVNIGYPSGWGAPAASAPSYGLSTHGGAQFNKGNVSGAPFTFNGQSIWHAGNDGSGSGLDADMLDGYHHTDLMMATATTQWSGLNASGAQARRYHIMRLYVCPAHWDSNHQNIKLFLHEESYESSYTEYHLWSDYNGGNQSTAIKLHVKDAGGNDHVRHRVVVGSPVDAGWDYSGQDVYYYDIYVEAAYYKQVRAYAHMRGHGYVTSNPTSGGATTVVYTSPTGSNISDFTQNKQIYLQEDLSVNGSVEAGALSSHGSAAAPTYSFNVDSDSGMFSLANNAIGFATNGLQRLKINNNGLLITGTSGLHVNGSEIIDSNRRIKNISPGSESAPGLYFSTDSDTGLYAGQQSDINALYITNNGSKTAKFGTGDAYFYKETIFSNGANSSIANPNITSAEDDTSGATTSYHINFTRPSGTSSGRIGGITSNYYSTAYATTSDYRLKENVNYAWDATTRLKQLRPCQFNWIGDANNALIDGFLAHEVQDIVEDAVVGEKDATSVVEGQTTIEPQSIDQSKLVPLLVKTIQELEARITALENS